MSAVVKPNAVAFDAPLICAVVGLIAMGTIMVDVGVGLDRRRGAAALSRSASRRRRRRGWPGSRVVVVAADRSCGIG